MKVLQRVQVRTVLPLDEQSFLAENYYTIAIDLYTHCVSAKIHHFFLPSPTLLFYPDFYTIPNNWKLNLSNSYGIQVYAQAASPKEGIGL